jgi:hypothetical protein
MAIILSFPKILNLDAKVPKFFLGRAPRAGPSPKLRPRTPHKALMAIFRPPRRSRVWRGHFGPALERYWPRQKTGQKPKCRKKILDQRRPRPGRSGEGDFRAVFRFPGFCHAAPFLAISKAIRLANSGQLPGASPLFSVAPVF